MISIQVDNVEFLNIDLLKLMNDSKYWSDVRAQYARIASDSNDKNDYF